MLNPFPNLLEFAILTPLLLRITIGLFFFFVGWTILFKIRDKFISYYKKGVIFQPTLSTWFLGIVTTLVGACFLIGFLTQYVAVISIGLSVYYMKLFRDKTKLLNHSYATYYFSILIAIAALILGAGPFAIDYPL